MAGVNIQNKSNTSIICDLVYSNIPLIENIKVSAHSDVTNVEFEKDLEPGTYMCEIRFISESDQQGTYAVAPVVVNVK